MKPRRLEAAGWCRQRERRWPTYHAHAAEPVWPQSFIAASLARGDLEQSARVLYDAIEASEVGAARQHWPRLGSVVLAQWVEDAP